MKYALMIIMFASSLLVTGCRRPDAKFSNKIVGTWKSGGDTQVFNSDGTFLFKTLGSDHTNEYAGIWVLKGGTMTLTATNVSGPDPEIQLGGMVQFTAINVDPHHLSYEVNGQTVSCDR